MGSKFIFPKKQAQSRDKKMQLVVKMQ